MASPIDPLTHLRECPDCGLFQRIGALRPGESAECERCGALLRRRRHNSLATAAALTCAGLFALFAAVISPLLGFRLTGRFSQTGLAGLPIGLEGQNMPLLAIVVLATTMLAPFLRLFLTTVAILGVRGGMPRGVLITMARLREILRPWAMIEVFMLGLFVAYTRLAALAQVTLGDGLYALGALVLLTAFADWWLDDEALWEAIGRVPWPPGVAAAEAPGAAAGGLVGCDVCGLVHRGRPGLACARCAVPLKARKTNSVTRTWALLIAAAVLYIPANAYPFLTVVRLGQGAPSTIIGGVKELVDLQMWPLALLVFVASITVPLLKLVGLGYLLITTQRGSSWRLAGRTRLYRAVDFIGRWSMIDIFMLSLLTALVRMGVLASVTPNAGAVAFAGVVVLTMLAAISFDPRVAWDAADSRAAAEAAAEPIGMGEMRA